MKTFLIDLHGGLARLGPALPLLYPYQAAGDLEVVGGVDGARPAASLEAVAEAVRVSVLRSYRARLQLVVLLRLPEGDAAAKTSLVEQADSLRKELLGALAKHGLHPARVVVVALDSLAREPHTGVPADEAARARWERDAVALRKDPAGALEGMLVLRFPLRRAPEAAFQQDLVRLVYLLATLLELFHGGEEVERGRLYLVDEVALDGVEVAAWLAEYEACLLRARRAVVHQLDHPEPVPLKVIEEPGCACTGALEPPEIRPREFGWLRHVDDFGAWRRWGEETGRVLAAHAEAGEALVRRCMREWRTRTFSPAERAVTDVAERAKETARLLEEARTRLARETRGREVPDWDEEVRRMTPRLHAVLDARPRPRAFAIFCAALLFLLSLPVLGVFPRVGLQGRLGTSILLLTGAAAMTWSVLQSLREELRDEAHRALERARETSARISEGVDRRKAHLAALCEVEVARRNDAEARAALRLAGERTMLLKHHRAELERHLQLARAFAAHQALGQRGLAPPPPPEGEAAAPLAKSWPVELPPFQNPAYAPALCTGAPREQPYEVRLGARVVRRSSPRVRGLRHVELADDFIYRPVAGGVAPAGD
ncbi:MAG TPA: hypothetical protein VHG91_18015 [Longimicrobium sp.]|nr:hypothetical protein [Longimicrobium sp.]